MAAKKNRYLFLFRSHDTHAGMKDLTDPEFHQSLRIALKVIKLPPKINTRDRNAVFAF